MTKIMGIKSTDSLKPFNHKATFPDPKIQEGFEKGDSLLFPKSEQSRLPNLQKNEDEVAATKIQSVVRMLFAKHEYQHLQQEAQTELEQEAATKIQAAFRGLSGRKRAEEIKEQKAKKAAKKKRNKTNQAAAKKKEADETDFLNAQIEKTKKERIIDKYIDKYIDNTTQGIVVTIVLFLTSNGSKYEDIMDKYKKSMLKEVSNQKAEAINNDILNKATKTSLKQALEEVNEDDVADLILEFKSLEKSVKQRAEKKGLADETVKMLTNQARIIDKSLQKILGEYKNKNNIVEEEKGRLKEVLILKCPEQAADEGVKIFEKRAEAILDMWDAYVELKKAN